MEKYVIFVLLFIGGASILFSVFKIARILIIEIRESRKNQQEQTNEDDEWDFDRAARIVENYSERYKRVKELHEHVALYRRYDCGGEEQYMFLVELDSKAKYDKYDPIAGLYEYVKNNRDRFKTVLDQIEHNRIAIADYNRRFEDCLVDTEPSKYLAEGISEEMFVMLENKLVNEQQNTFLRQVVRSLYVECNVVYRSHKGRNAYSKQKFFTASDVKTALQAIEDHENYISSEGGRRQVERSKVTPSIRYSVMSRDGFKCCLCGRSADMGVELEVDHIIPISKGGTSDMHNLQTLCRDCNRGKGAKY